MHTVARVLLLLLATSLAAPGCGGRDAGTAGTGTGGAADGGAAGTGGNSGSAGWGGGSGAANACVTSQGVRLCGGPCGPVPDCPGGCTSVFASTSSVDPSALDIGVCWTDLADNGTRPCTVCADGETCVQRTVDQLICVPDNVCSGLWALDAGTACRYADKSAYAGGPPASTDAACPDERVACGGGCGSSCEKGLCFGRSAHRPFGACTGTSVGQPNGCRLRHDGQPGLPCAGDWYCMIFAVDGVDQDTANAYGVCVPPEHCIDSATSLDVYCYDGNVRVAP